MTVSSQKTIGQLNSIRTSLIKVIMGLRVQEDALRKQDRHDEADTLTLQRLALNDKSILLWQAEAKARKDNSLAPAIAELSGIADDARKTAKGIETAARVLAAAVKLIEVLEKLVDLAT